jgi:hypothetical protein
MVLEWDYRREQVRALELRPRAEPVLRIDNREIVAARFVEPRVLLAEAVLPPFLRAHLCGERQSAWSRGWRACIPFRQPRCRDLGAACCGGQRRTLWPAHVSVARSSLSSRTVAMPGPRHETRALATPRSRPDGRDASARTAPPKKAGDGAPPGATRPEQPRNSGRRGHAGREMPEGPRVALRDLLHGLCAGDLESVLLTVAMAAEENRMPSADPDEARRILGFLARLAEHDPSLPPCPDGAGSGWNRPVDAD